ncbi:MAG: hypothetical protein WB493_13510 [Anaeromyxobacteraceae bacterium]
MKPRPAGAGLAFAVLFLLATTLVPTSAAAWIWPEHRDIAAEALRELPAAQKKTIDQMWVGVRAIGGKQVCEKVVDPGSEPTDVPRGEWDKVCVDFASFPALAGDHSCTAAELWSDAAKEPWAVKVVWVAAKTKERLASSRDEAQRTDFLSLSHLAMQYVDPRYLTRAEGNNAHFLFPRAPVAAKEDLDKYLDRVLSPGIEINATGLYAEYHMLALRYAALYHAAPEAEKAELGGRALLAEGVALHFLEDSFSAGHYAATWGGAAWQKGTHDLYSTIGLTTMTWKGDLFASHGDGHMTEQDMKVAAVTVRQSLAQVASAAEGRLPLSDGPLTATEKAIAAFNFCKEEHLPPAPDQPVARSATKMVLLGTPVPAGGKDEIHPPRSRAEIGPFVGAVSGYTLGLAMGGYDSWNNTRVRSEFEIGARVGYGLEGVITSNMDGQMWVQGELVAGPVQLDLGCTTCTPYPLVPSGRRNDPAVPRVGSRSALKLSMRMPFYVVPFDLIVLGPVLMLTSPQTLTEVVFAAAGGGVVPIERKWETAIGTFQVMAGREVGFTLWGFTGHTNQFIYTPTPNAADARIVNYNSLELDFPVLEYVPPRVFATTLALAAEMQLGFNVEFPMDVAYKATGESFSLGPSWNVYLRFRLDARKYFGGSSD